MKVLHAVPAYHPEGPGGIELYSRDLVRRQRDRGHAPSVLTGCAELRESTRIERDCVDGITVHRLYRDDPYFLHHGQAHHRGASAAFAELLSEQQPDVVHVHHWLRLSSDLVERAAEAGVPSVVTLHDVYASCPRCYRVDRWGETCTRPLSLENCRPCAPRYPDESEREVDLALELFRAQLRRELATAHAVLVPNTDLVQRLEQYADLPLDHVHVSPPGYRRRFADRPRPTSRRPGPIRIACWGRIARHKGFERVLAAFRHLHEHHDAPPSELLLFGEIDPDGLETELLELARDLPIRFLGPFGPDDLLAQDPDLAVFAPTAIETHGLVLDEALELGLPTVVAAEGPLATRAGDAVVRVDAGSDSALAGALADELRRVARGQRREPDPRSLPPDEVAHAAALDVVYRRAIDGGPRPVASEHLEPRRAELRSLQAERRRSAWAGPPT